MSLTENEIAENTQLLNEASYIGDIQKVQRLLPVSDPKQNDSQTLAIAARTGNSDLVQILIPVSEPLKNGSWALRAAVKYEHKECVMLLLPVCDYQLVLKSLPKHGIKPTFLHTCINEYEALLQKERLSNTLDEVVQCKNSVKRKL